MHHPNTALPPALRCTAPRHRLGTYSANAATMPPAAEVAARAMAADPRAEPKYAERVPYVVVHAEPGEREGRLECEGVSGRAWDIGGVLAIAARKNRHEAAC